MVSESATPPQGSPGPWITPTEIAERWAVTVKTVHRWARKGWIPSLRTPGGRLRLNRIEVEQALAERARKASLR